MTFSRKIGEFVPGNPAPLYIQLQHILRDAIEKRVLSDGEAIPAERDLAIEYGISRITVRKAVSGLVSEGLLTRRRGAGTFVATGLCNTTSRLMSFSEEMEAKGVRTSSKWIDKSLDFVTSEEAMLLGLSLSMPIYRLQRVRFANDVPVAYETSIIAGYCIPSIDVIEESIYKSLNQFNHRPVRALQRLSATVFQKDHAELLGSNVEEVAFLVERRGFLRDGRFGEFTKTFFRADSYNLVVEFA